MDSRFKIHARKSNSTSGGIKKSTSIFGKRPGTMKKQNKRTQNCVHGVYEFLSEKRPRITWIAYTSENLLEAYTSGI